MSEVSLAVAQPAGISPGLNKLTTFDEFPIGVAVRQAIAAMGFEHPTDVQSAVVGLGLAGRDLVVQAKTGSGKTAAFGIPLVERLDPETAQPGRPLALILTPTRELANQVAAELKLIAVKKGTRVLAIYGGVPMWRQTAGLKLGVEIVVGTPGRLLDHIRRGNLSLESARAIVLDEADEMLSMGFWDDVTDLLKMAPAQRQTMLYSATLPYQVAKAAATFLKDAERINVSGDELTVDGIANSIVHVVPDIPKPRQLLYLLETEQPSSAIIFCNTRNETDMIAKYLTQAGFVAEPLSGNFRQQERERVMSRIKSGELRYMVATDVAARGIDVEDLSHVVNYALPEFSEVYLHRVGRTGRAGKCGTAISLVDGRGLGTLSVLERQFCIRFTSVVLPEEAEILRRRSERIMKELSERASVAEVGQHLPVADAILAAPDAQQVVAFLLKQYFSSGADAERANGRESKSGSSEEVSETPAANNGANNGANNRANNRANNSGGRRRAAAPEREREANGGDGAERKRPRRRRRRRRPGAPGGAMDAMDAAEALASAPARQTAAAAASVAADVDGGAPEGGSAKVSAGGGAAASGAATSDAERGMKRVRVNIGFDDGFKGRGAVAKKITALAGLAEGVLSEVESRRDYAVLRATPEIAEMVVERVNGAQIGKKVVSVTVG